MLMSGELLCTCPQVARCYLNYVHGLVFVLTPLLIVLFRLEGTKDVSMHEDVNA